MSNDMPEASSPEPETRGPEFRRLVRVLSRQANCDHTVGYDPVWGFMTASQISQPRGERWIGWKYKFTFCPDCGKELLQDAPKPSTGNSPEAL